MGGCCCTRCVRQWRTIATLRMPRRAPWLERLTRVVRQACTAQRQKSERERGRRRTWPGSLRAARGSEGSGGSADRNAPQRATDAHTHMHTEPQAPGVVRKGHGIYKQKGQPEAEKSSFSKCTHHPTKRSAAKDGSMRCWHFIQVRLTRLHRLERSQTNYENWTYFYAYVACYA